jgi:hypothetical protein
VKETNSSSFTEMMNTHYWSMLKLLLERSKQGTAQRVLESDNFPKYQARKGWWIWKNKRGWVKRNWTWFRESGQVLKRTKRYKPIRGRRHKSSWWN